MIGLTGRTRPETVVQQNPEDVIALYTQLAHDLYPKRRYFAIVTFGAFVFGIFMSIISPRFVDVVGMVAMAVITVAWGLFCMCVWFEPAHGNLHQGWLARRLPRPIKVALQWYLGVFLAFWFLFGIVGVPLFFFWGDKIARWLTV